MNNNNNQTSVIVTFDPSANAFFRWVAEYKFSTYRAESPEQLFAMMGIDK